jgi:hypothetical protein
MKHNIITILFTISPALLYIIAHHSPHNSRKQGQFQHVCVLLARLNLLTQAGSAPSSIISIHTTEDITALMLHRTYTCQVTPVTPAQPYTNVNIWDNKLQSVHTTTKHAHIQPAAILMHTTKPSFPVHTQPLTTHRSTTPSRLAITSHTCFHMHDHTGER